MYYVTGIFYAYKYFGHFDVVDDLKQKNAYVEAVVFKTFDIPM